MCHHSFFELPQEHSVEEVHIGQSLGPVTGIWISYIRDLTRPNVVL
jgi:hypothetical protein